MNPANNMLLNAVYADGLAPVKVEEVGESTTYIGYCLPECTDENSPKWLIKRIEKTVTKDGAVLQNIYYADGSRLFNQKWSERKELTYKPTKGYILPKAEMPSE